MNINSVFSVSLASLAFKKILIAAQRRKLIARITIQKGIVGMVVGKIKLIY
jgi:hypothetical protein